MAVSYTHLDVYKRQVSVLSNIKRFSYIPQTHLLNVETVSYTHLVFEMIKPVVTLRSAHTITPYACWSISNISVEVLPSLKQIFMQTRCSSGSFIFTMEKICHEVRKHINFSCCSKNHNSGRRKQNIGWCFEKLPLVSATCQSMLCGIPLWYCERSGFLWTHLIYEQNKSVFALITKNKNSQQFKQHLMQNMFQHAV